MQLYYCYVHVLFMYMCSLLSTISSVHTLAQLFTAPLLALVICYISIVYFHYYINIEIEVHDESLPYVPKHDMFTYSHNTTNTSFLFVSIGFSPHSHLFIND